MGIWKSLICQKIRFQIPNTVTVAGSFQSFLAKRAGKFKKMWLPTKTV
jgi:hypothetical protein